MAEKKTTKLVDKLYKIQLMNIKVKQGGHNPHFKSKYIKLDDIMEKLDPILKKEKLLITHRGVDGYLETTLTDMESGETITSSFPLQAGVDAQKTGGAITYYKRYNVVCLFGILADEDDDGNSAVVEAPSEEANELNW